MVEDLVFGLQFSYVLDCTWDKMRMPQIHSKAVSTSAHKIDT